MFKIEHLEAQIEEKVILKGLNLEVQQGEIHAIMGPNGAGKSTVAKVVAGHPAYEVVNGKVLFENQDLLKLEPEERACQKMFVSFQHPPEIPGLILEDFLFHALNAQREYQGQKSLDRKGFNETLHEKMTQMGIPLAFAKRGLNDGFSGGEKRKVEMLQIALFDPKFIILDEIDSGLDVDAMRVIGQCVKQWFNEKKAILMITHYTRLLEEIPPDYVHVLKEGQIVASGDKDFGFQIEKEGYGPVLKG